MDSCGVMGMFWGLRRACVRGNLRSCPARALCADTAHLWVRRPECLCSEDVRWRKLTHHCMEGPHDKQGAFRGCTCPRGVRTFMRARLQTRSCGARAHTHKHPRTEMPTVSSHATCAAVLPSGSLPDPSSLSTQIRTRNAFAHCKCLSI